MKGYFFVHIVISSLVLVSCASPISPPLPPSSPSTSTPSQSSNKPSKKQDPDENSNEQGQTQEQKTGEAKDSQNSHDDWDEELGDGADISEEEGLEDGATSFETPSFETPSFEEIETISEEELDALEKELETSLEDFDEELQREQEHIERQARKNNESNHNSSKEVGEFEEYSGNTVQKKQPSSQNKRSESGNGGLKSSRKQADDSEAENQTVPDDISSGHDDDIVAKQIREAAENEQDPILREKLWQEYRKYKKQ